MRVVLAGGGTAGHIEPALALADALRQADPSAMIVCLGTERGLETRLVPLRGYELALIPPVPLPRQLTPQLLSVPGRLGTAVSSAARVLAEARADVLVGFGGYVATPGYLAARRRHVPIVVHEANARPGLANKLGARLTENVFTGHPATQLAHPTPLPWAPRSGGRSPSWTGWGGGTRPGRTSACARTCRCCWSPADRREPG